MAAKRKAPAAPVEASSAIGQRRSKAMEKGSAAYSQRRHEIAAAAAAVFDRRGYRGTSFSAVAQELGIDRATLYYYVGSKEELFDSVVREAAQNDVALAESVRDGDGSPLEKLHTLIRALMSSYATNYPLLYVYMRENLAHVDSGRPDWTKQMASLNRRYDCAITAVVQAGIDDGTISTPSTARVVAFGIIGMVGWTNRWYDPDRTPETADAIGTAYADLVVRGLASR